MSAYAIRSELASFTKLSKNTITIKPLNLYMDTELNDERLHKLYSMYCGLLIEQYAEDCEKLKSHP